MWPKSMMVASSPPADEVALSSDVAHSRETARKYGWAIHAGSLEEVRAKARRLGWQEVSTRRGDRPVAELRPTAPEHAHARSLSATYGLGAQPLHTDGAHLLEPPDLVVLCADQSNGTPTLLWSSFSKLSNPRYPRIGHSDYLDNGMFLVNGAGRPFLAPAHDSSMGWRYDPGCMTACDQRARQVDSFFREASSDAYRHEWSKAGQVLFIDNQRALHARSAISENEEHRLLRRITFDTQAIQ